MSASLILSRGGRAFSGMMGVWLKSRAGAASVGDNVRQRRRDSIAFGVRAVVCSRLRLLPTFAIR